MLREGFLWPEQLESDISGNNEMELQLQPLGILRAGQVGSIGISSRSALPVSDFPGCFPPAAPGSDAREGNVGGSALRADEGNGNAAGGARGDGAPPQPHGSAFPRLGAWEEA